MYNQAQKLQTCNQKASKTVVTKVQMLQKHNKLEIQASIYTSLCLQEYKQTQKLQTCKQEAPKRLIMKKPSWSCNQKHKQLEIPASKETQQMAWHKPSKNKYYIKRKDQTNLQKTATKKTSNLVDT